MLDLDMKQCENGVNFKVKVQPRSAKNQICGLLGDALKVKITAPPVDGEANKVLQEFLAKTFKVAKSKVQIIAGQTGKSKIVQIQGLVESQVVQILKEYSL